MNWKIINTPVNENFTSVQFLNTYDGFISGSNGTILKTQNAGLTWTALNSNTSSNLNHLKFFDSNVGFAVGDGGTIVNTSDGGSNWSVQTSGTVLKLRCIAFSTKDTVFVGSENGLFKTYDRGITWIKDPVDFKTIHFFTSPNQNYNNIKQIDFTSINKAYVLTDGTSYVPSIFKTDNRGSSWITIHANGRSDLKSIYFINDNEGYKIATGTGAAISKTLNSGQVWA